MVKTVADHLGASGIFSKIQPIKDWRESKGSYDATLVITVVYYEGDKIQNQALKNIGVLGGSVPLIIAGAYEGTWLLGYATLDIKVKRASGEILWQGEVKGRAEGAGKGKLMDIPLSPEIAAEALKDAVNNLAEKLKDVAF
jgi:hypothetical protein